ncbi:MAG TPA: hypothetical protein VIT85_00640 [Solirubrobacterales bacterium]
MLQGISMAAGAVLLFWLLRDAPYTSDEWLLMTRAQGWDLGGIFEPWNGHLLAVGQLLARLSIHLFGPDYGLLIAFDIVGVLALSALVYVFARRRIDPILAVVPAMVPLFYAGASAFYGAGIQLTPLMGINGVYSLAFGLAALLLLERERRKEDIAAALMLGLSLASFSYGLAFAVGCGVAVGLSPNWRRRAWAVAVPLGLYCLWRLFATFHWDAEAGAITVEHVLLSPFYFADAFSASVAGYFGLAQMIGRGPAIEYLVGAHLFESLSLPIFLVVTQLALFVWVGRRLGREGLMRASIWPPIATLVAMWGSQALVMDTTARMPGDTRYLFAGAVLIAVAASELARNARVSRFAIWVVLAIAIAGAFANLPRFREAKQSNDVILAKSRVVGAVFEIGGDSVDPDYNPAVEFPELGGPMFIPAGAFQDFAERNGSLATLSATELLGQSPELRADADRLLADSTGLRLRPAAAPPRRATCLPISAGATLSPSPGLYWLSSPSEAGVGMSRFAYDPSVTDEPMVELGTVSNRGWRILRVPRDELPENLWHLGSSGPGPLRACFQP